MKWDYWSILIVVINGNTYSILRRPKSYLSVLFSLIDPQSRPVVIIVFSTCRPSVPTFQNKTDFKRKQCSLLARLWVWPSGSLMTHVLYPLVSIVASQKGTQYYQLQIILFLPWDWKKILAFPILQFDVLILFTTIFWSTRPTQSHGR